METGKDYQLGNGSKATYLGIGALESADENLWHRFAYKDGVNEAIMEVGIRVENTVLTKEERVIDKSEAYVTRTRWNPNFMKEPAERLSPDWLAWNMLCEGHDGLLHELLMTGAEN